MTAIGTRLLTLKIDGEEYAAEVSNVRITSAESDSDFVTFADAAAGGARDYTLAMTMTQDLEDGSLWREVWDNPGTEVPFRIRPYGNTTASTGQSHFSGTAVITEPDGDFLGGEANASATAKMTIEVEWPCTARPTRATSGT